MSALFLSAKAAMKAGRLEELSAMQAKGFDVNATDWAWRAWLLAFCAAGAAMSFRSAQSQYFADARVVCAAAC